MTVYTYPGVYIEEVPSGVRTISGVATSIGAFVGWAPKGPTDAAYKMNSWADYERMFGGLHASSYLSYGVYQFFLNGGQQAHVIRLVQKTGADAATLGEVNIAGLKLEATGEGKWSKDYSISIKQRSDPNPEKRFGLTVLYVKDGVTSTVESYDNLSMSPDDPRFVESVINDSSGIVNARVTDAAQPPSDGVSPLSPGTDGPILLPGDDAFVTALKGDDKNPGVNYLRRVDLFNLLVVPGMTSESALQDLEAFCQEERAILIADCDKDAQYSKLKDGPDPKLTGSPAINAAFYFPWVKAADPLQQNRMRAFPPSGFMAGIYARTDASRGVWKAPAGTDASLVGVGGVTQTLTDNENGDLNIRAINCIRNFPVYGTIAWGARTLRGNNEIGSEWKYIPVRRTALFIEESLFRGLKWVVFEPNDEPLWASIRLNAGAFMHDLFRQGAFQGSSPRDAYFVKCDHETTTQNDINLGIVNIVVGFAPLKPAEFVVIKIQQMAGQIEV
jgi:uncharacterized protein